MKILVAVLLVAWFSAAAVAATHDVGLGTIEASEDFVFQKGATDSVLGTLTRKSDGFTIRFDVGGLAGIHMHGGRRAQCTFYRDHRVGDQPASTGIESVGTGQRITISIGDVVKSGQSPANFWTDIRKDSDIAEFMLIVTTYRVKANDP